MNYLPIQAVPCALGLTACQLYFHFFFRPSLSAFLSKALILEIKFSPTFSKPTIIKMKVTYLGHASFQFQIGSTNLILDPFITQNPLAQKARAERQAAGKEDTLDIEALEADYMLLTHGHGDHIGDAAAIAERTGATIVSGFEVTTFFGEKGLKGHPLNHGGKWKFDFGTVKYVNAIHSSSITETGKLADSLNGGNPGGFVVWGDGYSFYAAGDTALTMDMKLIPMTCPKLDFAILPIGDAFTMGYEDAVIAAEFVACDRIIGCHYDTFGLIEIDHEAAKKAFADKGKELILMPIGDSMEL